jgi:uncharacterized membrane protein YoaK (UPF0700 family)
VQRYDRPRRILGFGIAALAGFVDATGFLAANGYFVSFMSGNTTRLGVDLATHLSRAAVPALLIVGFVCGVLLGALVAEKAGRRRKTAVIGLSSALLCIAALVRASGGENSFVAFLVVAMGVLNNSFRRNGEVAVGVTYMTGALVRFGQDLAGRLIGRERAGGSLNLFLWASLALGAFSGAAVAHGATAASAWIAAAFSLALLGAAAVIESCRPDHSS